MEAHRLEQEAA
jgi:hypothetical protein